MDSDIDDEDLLSLSERILPLTSTSYTNYTSSRDNNFNRLIKLQKTISSDNQISHEEDTSLSTTANIGDIIKLSDGTRKKYNGSSWRRMCSKPNCSYYTQSGGLCKPHLAELQKRKSTTNKDNFQINDDTSFSNQILSEQEEPKKGDVIILGNGIRKKYDGRQYRRVCVNPSCMIVVHGSLEYQNGLCPHHYQEFRAKNLSESKFLPNSSTSIVSSPSRKRRRPNSPSSFIPSQVPLPFNIQNSVPKSNRRVSIAVIPPSVDIKNPKKGDIIDMENGSRKKFDGVVWRKICLISDCFIAAQRNELCRKHFIKLNGKPNNGSTMDIIGAVTMVTPISKSFSSMSTSSIDDRSGSRMSKKLKNEPIDYNDEQEELNNDNTSNSYNMPDDHTQQNGHYQENSSAIEDDHLGTQIDHTLIHALSTSRQKFPTNHLKKWLGEHQNHPYPSNQEKIELAKQSFITYDQVTTWFNNARAILRRHQTKLRHSFDTADDDDDDNESLHENEKYSDLNHKVSSKVHRSFPLFNGVYCRSIGVQCNPSTANQTTSTTTNFSDDELTSDRTIRILTPSKHVLKTVNTIKRSGSEEFLINGIRNEDDEDFQKDQEIIITSTCLDEDQMTRLKEFCSRFQIKLSNIVDQYSTHLITDEEEDKTLVCSLSKKVIQAVARHMYIVTYRWIDACLKLNQIINEKPFEIQGDLTLSSDHHGMQRSRQSILSIKNLLFENISIMLKCDGCQEMLNNDELIELVQLSGAKYTTDSHFSRLQTGIIRVVLCEKDYLTNRKEMYEKCVHAGIHFLTPEWFLESIVQYRIQPFQEYQISPDTLP